MDLNGRSFSRTSIQPSSSRLSIAPDSTYRDGRLKVVKSQIAPSGESIQLIRPIAEEEKTSDDIVTDLIRRYDYKTNEVVKASSSDLKSIQQAFGTNLATKLLTTYDGSAIAVDQQQDLIGDKYLAEQIRQIQTTKKSVVERYAHLMYEGEKDDKSHVANPLEYSRSSMNLRPIQQTQFVLNNNGKK